MFLIRLIRRLWHAHQLRRDYNRTIRDEDRLGL